MAECTVYFNDLSGFFFFIISLKNKILHASGIPFPLQILKLQRFLEFMEFEHQYYHYFVCSSFFLQK